MKTAILSIHERYATKIFARTKKYEFRRRAPDLDTPIRFFVYVPGRRSMAGEIIVTKILKGSPTAIWKKTGKQGGITRAEFMNYFAGRETAYAYAIKTVKEYDTQPTLEDLRSITPGGFHPPQYLKWAAGPAVSAFEAAVTA